jgi:ATP-dependent exoDNAse (exonuclease V) beta subunit
VGSLFHAALRYWRFPGEGGLENFLRPFALQAGLTDPREIKATIADVRRLLARFQASPIYARLDQVERYHETPYTLVLNGRTRSGVVDLLCRLDGEWTVVEFKTDELDALADVRPHIERERYDRQMREYVAAVTRLVGERPRGLWIFVNVGGDVVEIELDPSADCGRIH